MKKRYKIVSPVRFFIFVLIVILSLTGTTDTYRQVEIHQNDTLWSIADRYCGKSIDPRTAVDKICNINGINASDVQPGDTILVPVES